MEEWTDSAIILGARSHGENGAVVSVLSRAHGRYAGYVHGARSPRTRGLLESGNRVQIAWRARMPDQLGTFSVESDGAGAAPALLYDPLRLSAMLSACALCEAALPDREGHGGLFAGLEALLDHLGGLHWGAAYIFWEIAFLRELGFGLDLSRCALGGDPQTLEWVSPKSGRAVSREAGAPYADRLLPLPAFLKPTGGDDGPEEIVKGLDLTGKFLDIWAFAHHSHGVPEQRRRFRRAFRTEPALQKEGEPEISALAEEILSKKCRF